jgi:hypothetical protein
MQTCKAEGRLSATQSKMRIRNTKQNMGEFFRDSIWTFVGAVLAVAAIIVSVLIYLGQKQRKRLCVERIADVPLTRSGFRGIDGLQITYRGRTLDRPVVVLARISNPGNAPIQRADFEAPITLEFEQDTEILEVSVLETQPSGIPVSAEINGATAVLSPHLLNPGDTVLMRILLAESGSKFKPSARIAGVVVIETRARTSLWPPIIGVLGVLILILSAVYSPTPRSVYLSEIRPDEIPYLIAMILSTLLILGTFFRDLFARLGRIKEKILSFV